MIKIYLIGLDLTRCKIFNDMKIMSKMEMDLKNEILK